MKARTAIDEQDAERVLELLDAGRKGRLGDAAAFRGAAEIAFARQGQQEFELVDHGRAPSDREAASAAARLAQAVMKAAWLQARFFAEVWAPVVWSNCSERSPLSGVKAATVAMNMSPRRSRASKKLYDRRHLTDAPAPRPSPAEAAAALK